jgi:MFS family permease
MTGRALRHPVVGRLMILTLVAGLAFNGIESTFGFWATHRYNWTPANIGLCFTVAAITSALGQSLLTGALSRRYGQAPMLAFGIVVTVICLALQPFSPWGVTTIAIMSVMSLGQSVAFPNTSALISRSTDPDRQGQMLGLNNAMGGMARLIGPQAAIALFYWRADAPFFVGAAVTAPAILLALGAGRAASKLTPERALAHERRRY